MERKQRHFHGEPEEDSGKREPRGVTPEEPMFSSLGLPGLNGFIGEFLIFKGSFTLAASATAVAVIGLLVTAIAFARAMQALFSGPLAESCSAFPDLVRSEKLVVVPITLLMFAIGIAPQFVLNIFNTTVVQMARLFA